jgi:hypothetical protein
MGRDPQLLVEAIADRLGLPVSLTDPNLNSLCFSPHSDELIDDVRRDSLLYRTTAAWVREWFLSYGVDRATGPVRIAPLPGTTTLGRWVVPVRFHGKTHGLLCVLDPEERCGLDDADAIQDLVGELAEVMEADADDGLESARNVRDLLTGAPPVRERAALAIEHTTGLAASSEVRAVAASGAPASPGRSDTPPDQRGSGSRTPLLQATSGDHHVFLAPADEPLDRLTARVLLMTARCCGHPVVGVGEARPLDQAATSYEQAWATMVLAARLTDLPAVLPYADLGALRFLVGRSDADLAGAIDPAAGVLLRTDDAELIATVERYLESGGDVAATAGQLNVHRGTLYYRLRKVETLTGLDLTSGSVRLSVHLSLLAARIIRGPGRVHHPHPVRLLT